MAQGSVLSPTLFNLYINDALSKLTDANIQVLAFADDLAFVARNQIELYRGLNILQEWCSTNQININKKKSAIFYLRTDRRTPLPFTSTRGFKVVTSYTYLGVQLDDSFSFKPAADKLSSSLRSFKHKLTMTWALKLPPKVRLQAWQSLILSRFMYGLVLMSQVSDKMKEALHQLWYRAFKGLMNINSNPQQDDLLRLMLGTPA